MSRGSGQGQRGRPRILLFSHGNSFDRGLDKDPESQMKIRQTAITQLLLNHDGVYRWEAVLCLLGMQPLPMLQSRKRALRDLVATIEEKFAQR